MNVDTQDLRQLFVAGVLLLFVAAFAFLNDTGTGKASNGAAGENGAALSLDERVIPSGGVLLPITWGDMGERMIAAGVIDVKKLELLYSSRGGMSPNMKNSLYGRDSETVTINRENANELLNLLWAFGLSNKNSILEHGPMMNPAYGADAGRFASTGGWTLAVGGAMDHYSAHSFVSLPREQQEKVETVSKGIYRPCCGTPVYFPDCNHGMAMLGLLELLAAEDASEETMYDIALAVNAYWFPDTYMTLATYFEQNGTNWDSVRPRVALGTDYSSVEGYRRVLEKIAPVDAPQGGSCGA